MAYNNEKVAGLSSYLLYLLFLRTGILLRRTAITLAIAMELTNALLLIVVGFSHGDENVILYGNGGCGPL